MSLQLQSLDKAIKALERSLVLADGLFKDIKIDPDLHETVRAGVIQHFEVAFELSWKYIQRWIRENKTPEDADNPRTRKDLFRLAARYNLIANPSAWFDYGDARNLTSHVYEESKAEIVYKIAKIFLNDAKYLLTQLEKSSD